MTLPPDDAAESSSYGAAESLADTHTPIVVGIGGSAGALGALMSLLEALGHAPIAVVVVLHLSPDHESHAVEILQRITPLKVTQVVSRTALQAGHVYVLAPGMNLVTDDGHVQPAHAGTQRPSFVIDRFFRSLAEVHRDRAIGVVLSGTGSDGSLGLTHVKECGGLTIAQSPDDCEHAQMPEAAIDSGHVDLRLSAADIGKRIADIALGGSPRGGDQPLSPAPDADERTADDSERAFHDILAALRVRTRHDFRPYKRATLMRRLERRMQIGRLPTIQAYRDHVRSNPDELVPLLADFLISVTNFFRDGLAFEAVQRDIIAPILQDMPAGEEVRVWVPACASGEEAYSIAILLQEHADRMPRPPRMQLFASDISEAALSLARTGVYPANIAADVNDSRLMSFFEKEEGGRYRVRTAVRELIVFAYHNVLGDPPFSRLDLICCRNLLIYLDRTAQAAALEMFAYALKPGGYLFLGNAESIDASADAFQVVNKEHRIYRVRTEAAAYMRSRVPPQLVNGGSVEMQARTGTVKPAFPARAEEPLMLMHERALVAASPPSVLVNADAEIERVSPGAGRFVAFGEGIPSRNLLSNVPADVRIELRAALFRAGESRRPVQAVFRRGAEADGTAGTTLALTVHPIVSGSGDPVQYLVVFAELLVDPVRPAGMAAGVDVAYMAGIRQLEDENRSLKSHLQETLDRSAVSNEELKASNEELQAINEELRSAKEELETSKEELQSVNEELTTVNFELRLKVDEAGRNYDDLRNLMEASDIATIFVDSGMRVKRFTPQASKLFSLIPSDLGRPLMDVKTRLHYDEIADDASAVFKQLRPVERSVSSVDDEHFFARILPYRTSTDKIGGAVLTFINVTELRRAEERIKTAEERLRDAIASNKDFAVLSADIDGIITTWNEGARRIFGHEAVQAIGQPMDMLFTAADRAAGVPAAERQQALREGRATDERYHLRADGTTFFASGILTPLQGSGRSRSGFVKIARDSTEAKAREITARAELANQRRDRAAAEANSSQKDEFLAVVSHELKQPLNLIQLNAEMLIRLPETQGVPAVQRIGKTLKQAVAAQSTIVNDLLDLSRIQTGKMHLQREPTDLAALVRQLAHLFAEGAAAKRIELSVDVPDQVICNCDPVRMEQIVWNLLGNALKFTGENGRISVRIAIEGDKARLVVADTGIGIAPSFLPRVFDLFDQGGAASTGHHRTGLGIGLALVRELIEAHGGSIEAASPGEGLGATFTIEIGLSARAPREVAAAVHASLSRRILMVDDSPENLWLFAELLRMEGAQVDTATRGAEALDMLANGT
jgi:two-component system CheB/CheR fusion protein